jgi:hypothetical protein
MIYTFCMVFYRVLLKITNKKQVLFEKVPDEFISDENWIRPIKVKEQDIDQLQNNHFIWSWYQSFLERKDLPAWIYKSDLLEFELIRE